MSILIGTSTEASYPLTSWQFNRSIVKTTLGKLVLFANLGDTASDRLKYKTSSDDGATWDAAWTSVMTTEDIESWDIYIDTNNDIYVVWATSLDDIRFKKLTYGSGTWSIGSTVNIYTGALTDERRRPIITKRTNGDLWVAYMRNNTNILYYRRSSDSGSTWSTESSIGSFPVGTNYLPSTIQFIPVGDEIWLFSITNKRLRKWDTNSGGNTLGAWSDGTDVQSDDLIMASAGALSVTKISDSNIWAACRATTGIRVYNYNGSSWDSGADLSVDSSDNYAAIGTINNQPFCVWRRDAGVSDFDIAYRKYNGSSWDAYQKITSDGGTLNIYPAIIKEDANTAYFVWRRLSASPYEIRFEKVKITTQTILSDTKIKATGIQYTLTSDTTIIGGVQQTILSDTKIKAEDIQQSILSDTYLVDRLQNTILSDTKIKALGLPQTILSDTLMVTEGFINILSKFNFIQPIIININHKFTSVRKIIKDINHYFNMVLLQIKDINHDIRTKKLELSNINHDCRFYHSWQKVGAFGFQSLGKTYIKVYINSVEQTDVDNDSINIYKNLDSSHTASFNLARQYDSTKPNMESEVEIKYHIWSLYKGYITSISPSDRPESIRINCQDEFWKQNKTNTYFQVGHKPKDNKELYYATIQEALSTELNVNFGIGAFVPQNISCFSSGKSSSISNLIQECGNYSYFYDIDKLPKLWIAGEGNIVNIERQTINTNIGLYQLIEHEFNEDASSIINKFRVQMGEKVTRRFNSTGGSKNYIRLTKYFDAYAIPDWDSDYEILAKDSGDGEGYDKHSPGNDFLYKDVFKKYNLPTLDPELESYTDWRKPEIIIIASGNLYNATGGLLESGWSIDYEDNVPGIRGGTLTLSDSIFQYDLNEYGECESLSAPRIHIRLYKEKYISLTASDTENPETEVSNELMFFTNKMGDYPETIIGDLSLSDLNIQEGVANPSITEINSFALSLGWADNIVLGKANGTTTSFAGNLGKSFAKPLTISINDRKEKFKDNGFGLLLGSKGGTGTVDYNTGVYAVTYNEPPETFARILGSYEYTPNYTPSSITQEPEIIPTWNDTDFATDMANWKLSQVCDKKIKGTITLTLDALCYYNIDLSKRIYIAGITETPMNIMAINYNMSNFTVNIELENSRYYKRSISLQSRGE